MQGQMAQMVWSAGSAQVQKAVHTYGRIDLFRPYFDVQPQQVRARLIQAFIPKRPSQMQPPNDLYGPLMLIFTLVALLLLHMKSSSFTVQNGTLMGTALLTCFGYWGIVGMGLYSFLYIFVANALPLVQVLSVLGYGLVGHCVVILLTAVFHPVHSHMFFLLITAVFCGLTVVRMVIFFASKARDRVHKLVIAAALTAVHFAFLTYLHFAFESIVEELDEVLQDKTSDAHQLFTIEMSGLSDSTVLSV